MLFEQFLIGPRMMSVHGEVEKIMLFVKQLI